MRNFNEVYKEKVNESEQLHESKILGDFRKIYNALLEHYNLTAIHDLNEKSQISFLTELNQYWSEESGLNEIGTEFLEKRSLRLTENSTPLQKKNFLKTKTTVLLNETLRQNDVKYKVYSIIDEMYNQIKGESIEDVLTPNAISDIITEAMAESLDEIITTIRTELNESVKPKEQLNESVKPKVFLRKKLNEDADIAHVDNQLLSSILSKELKSPTKPILIITDDKLAGDLIRSADRWSFFQTPGSNFASDVADLTNQAYNQIMAGKLINSKPTLIISKEGNKYSQSLSYRIRTFKYSSI